MKNCLVLFLCVSFTAVNGQAPRHMFPTSINKTGNKISMMPVLFSHGEPAIWQKNGPIEERMNDKLLFAGSVKKGRLHGTWQSWYQNGLPCDSGNLYKGLPDGVWKHWDEQGQLVAVRTYNAEKYERISQAMLRYHPKRASYPLAKIYSDNKKAALHFLHVASSFDIVNKNTSLSIKEQVTNNITNKNNYKPVFNRSLQHGLFMNYYPGGAVKDSGYYYNGLRHGIWKRADEKGNTETGAYHHGIKVKEWKLFDPFGKMLELIVYSPAGKIKRTRSMR